MSQIMWESVFTAIIDVTLLDVRSVEIATQWLLIGQEEHMATFNSVDNTKSIKSRIKNICLG